MNKKASALFVMALWLVSIFSLFAAGLYRLCAAQLKVSARLEESIKAENAALSLLAYAQARAKTDPWFESMLKFGQLADVGFECSVAGEESKLNLNQASPEAIARLPGFDRGLAEAISASAFRPFTAGEELPLVEGMSPEILSQAGQFITIHSNGKVNINTASRQVLFAAGLADDAIDDVILPFLAGDDKTPGTDDDRIFKSSQAAIEQVQGRLGNTAAAQVQDLFNRRALDVKSETFNLKIVTKRFDKLLREYDIIFTADKLLCWREK